MREIQAAKKINFDILNNPVLKTAYLTGQYAAQGGEACANPDEYLYWDRIHPTRAVHQLLSAFVMNDLEKNL